MPSTGSEHFPISACWSSDCDRDLSVGEVCLSSDLTFDMLDNIQLLMPIACGRMTLRGSKNPKSLVRLSFPVSLPGPLLLTVLSCAASPDVQDSDDAHAAGRRDQVI